MSKQDLDYALSDLETALSVISDNVVMPVSGNIYPWYNTARSNLRRAKESLEQLHEHPFVEERETPEDYEPESCYCNTTSHPPCGFCTKDTELLTKEGK